MLNSKISNLVARRANEDESGFTLIELLIVMIIIGVLASIAIPAFLNQQKGARDTQTTSDVRNAAIAAQTLLTQYPDADFFIYNTVSGNIEARSGAATGVALAVEPIKLSAGTSLSIRGMGAGNDGFRIAGFNPKGKIFTSATVSGGEGSRIYDSNTGGIQQAPGILGS